MFISVVRTSKFAFQNFWRNWWLTVITIFLLTLTMFTVSLVATLNVLADRAIQSVEEKINIDVYFKNATSETDIIAAQVWLQNIPTVKNVRYVSKADALEKFKTDQANNPTITDALAELQSNPLPASLVIQAYTLDDYPDIISQFEASQFNQLVQDKNFSDHQLVIERLSLIIQRAYQAGIVISAIFVLISVIMLYNTIRVAIYSQREELAIMKLVGATNWFVRSPFILEGSFYALFSSVLAMGLLWGLILIISPYIDGFFAGYDFSLIVFFYHYFWVIFVGQFIVSLVLAVASTMLCMGRYLKV